MLEEQMPSSRSSSFSLAARSPQPATTSTTHFIHDIRHTAAQAGLYKAGMYNALGPKIISVLQVADGKEVKMKERGGILNKKYYFHIIPCCDIRQPMKNMTH